MASHQRLTTVFRGRVQGVGFRATAKDVARRFPVTGFARNESDGSVLCVAEGLPEEIDVFMEALCDAMRCNIAAVESTRDAATGEFGEFSIER